MAPRHIPPVAPVKPTIAPVVFGKNGRPLKAPDFIPPVKPEPPPDPRVLDLSSFTEEFRSSDSVIRELQGTPVAVKYLHGLIVIGRIIRRHSMMVELLTDRIWGVDVWPPSLPRTITVSSNRIVGVFDDSLDQTFREANGYLDHIERTKAKADIAFAIQEKFWANAIAPPVIDPDTKRIEIGITDLAILLKIRLPELLTKPPERVSLAVQLRNQQFERRQRILAMLKTQAKSQPPAGQNEERENGNETDRNESEPAGETESAQG